MAARKGNDHHWDFLEEIEAPMWVDLTIESNAAYYQDSDDSWFGSSHQFHQCSATQLKLSFLNSKERIENSVFESQQSSPNLPSSVSRSRGKYYKSRIWGNENKSLLSNKELHIGVLDGKQPKAVSRYVEELKSKSSKDHESSSLESNITNNLKAIATKVGERISTSALLSVMKITLRKSCVTRQASRVEIKHGSNEISQHCSSSKSSVETSSSLGNDGLKKNITRANNRKYSSSKSSIGSSSSLSFDNTNKNDINAKSRKYSTSKSSIGSSSNLGCDPLNKTRKSCNLDSQQVSSNKSCTGSSSNLGHAAMKGKKEEKTSDSIIVLGIAQALTSRASKAKLGKPKEGKTVNIKTARQEAVKSKVIREPTNRKALGPQRVNQQGPTTGGVKATDKLQVNRVNKRVAGEKENAPGRKAGSQEVRGKNIEAEGLATDQKMKQRELGKVRITALTSLKGKVGDQIDVKNPRRVIHKVHFR